MLHLPTAMRSGPRLRRGIAAMLLLAICLLSAVSGAAAQAPAIPGPHVWTPTGRLPTPVPLENYQGRLAVPLRALAEGVGALVAWDAASREVVITRGNLALRLRQGEAAGTLNGAPVTFDFAPYLRDGHLMAPARSLLTALQAPFRWDGTGLWLEQGAPHPATGQTLVLDDPGYGITLRFPDPWQLHGDLAPVRLMLQRPGAKLEIYTERLRPHSSPASYIEYGNRSVLSQWNGMTLRVDRQVRVGGQPARLLEWERPALPLPEDRRRYAEWDVIRPGNVMTTFILKADDATWAQARAEVQAMVNSVRFREPAWGHQFNRVVGPSGSGWQARQQTGRLRWTTPEPGRPMWGLFDATIWPHPGFTLQPLQQVEARVGYKFPFLMTYQVTGKPFPTDLVQAAARDGRLVMLTLQPWEPTDPYHAYHNGSSQTFRVLRGEFDQYLRAYARAMKAFGEPVFFRYANEMNGDWTPWSAFQFGKDTDLYVEEWKHVRRIFAEEGATNAIWVWNPHDGSFPYFRWNHEVLYYPGDEWVDWVGLTGYNLGDAYAGDTWRSFRQIYRPIYDEYSQLYPDKPFLITEFASHDSPGDKAAWIREVAEALPEFPNIRMVVWWNGTDGNRRYRFDSTPGALEAFRAALQAPYLSNTVRWVEPSAP